MSEKKERQKRQAIREQRRLEQEKQKKVDEAVKKWEKEKGHAAK